MPVFISVPGMHFVSSGRQANMQISGKLRRSLRRTASQRSDPAQPPGGGQDVLCSVVTTDGGRNFGCQRKKSSTRCNISEFKDLEQSKNSQRAGVRWHIDYTNFQVLNNAWLIPSSRVLAVR
ncbi:hypothetical protein VP1G_10860 [Cytospora mali]|uniref:Uncharacterized protein n=1 Tax=Cytospora mali TaxID=578113 RepID=A0A194UZ55_CYTMA|nr:hypothetical protein VP1G_10860 [Valsa mali var. pyri (nom. inval.)]